MQIPGVKDVDTKRFFLSYKIIQICSSLSPKFSGCEGSKLCNCDMNDNEWRKDAGWLTDKDYLPVTAISVSDTGSSWEEAKVTLGPLVCSGKQPPTCQ